jgi:HD-like signal output (HDOD) protein
VCALPQFSDCGAERDAGRCYRARQAREDIVLIVIVGVDDARDNALGNSLEQALAEYGLECEVRRVADAAAALALPATDGIDVFVAGAWAGSMEGAALLSQLRTLHPSAVRILLVEPSQDMGAMQALDVAHRLLHVPLDAGELIESIESVVELRDLLDSPELKRTIGRIGALPPPPRVYIELSQLLRDPDASNAEIAEMLAQDPAIAAKVLRMCNSAYFSGGRVITDFRSAVTRLGHHALRRLVLASETFGSIQSAGSIDRETLQDRALRTSRLAGRLLGGSSAELAATAGLLAEIGMLLPGVRADGTGEGPHYAEAGAYLLGLWGLPMPIVQAVAYHPYPSKMRSAGFWVTGAVHVASALVAGREVDESYLRAVGVIDKLGQWRAMVEPAAEAA